MIKPGNPEYRYIYAIWAFLECLGFGGLIYGWGSLVYVLMDEGLYLDLCDDSRNNGTDSAIDIDPVTNMSNANGNASYVINTLVSTTSAPSSESSSCDERDSMLALVFTIGSTMFCLGSFVMGQINFSFGTRVTRLIASFLFIIGSLMIAFTSNETPWLIFPGLSCIGIGGITFLMTNTQISLLFPAGGSFVIGLICGGFDASSGIQFLVKIGHENGVSRQTSFIILACAHVLTLVSTFLFLPKDFIKAPSAKYVPSDCVADDDEGKKVELMNGRMEEEAEEEKIPSLKESLLSPFYFLHIMWLSILQLRFYFFLASLNPVMHKMLTDDEVSSYTNAFMYILICGLFTSPMAGFVFDGHKRFFRNAKSEMARVMMPPVIPLAVTSMLCIIWSGMMLVEEPNMLYAVFVMVLFFRSFLYTMGAGFISAFFPIPHFGPMYGILLLVGGCISAFQYALFSWAEATSFNQVNVFLLVLMFVTFIHPLYIWRKCIKHNRSASIN